LIEAPTLRKYLCYFVFKDHTPFMAIKIPSLLFFMEGSAMNMPIGSSAKHEYTGNPGIVKRFFQLFF